MQTTVAVITPTDNYIDFHAGNSISEDWPKLSRTVHILLSQNRLCRLYTFIDCLNYIAKPLAGNAIMITSTCTRLQFRASEDAIAFKLQWK